MVKSYLLPGPYSIKMFPFVHLLYLDLIDFEMF